MGTPFLNSSAILCSKCQIYDVASHRAQDDNQMPADVASMAASLNRVIPVLHRTHRKLIKIPFVTRKMLGPPNSTTIACIVIW